MKKTYVILGLVTALMMAASPMASAAELKATTTTTAKGIIDFNALDTDRDGTLTETEFSANENLKGTKFGDVDKNDDGTISGEELSTWARVHGKGNAVGSVNSVNGVTGTVGVPNSTHNVTAGAGASIGTKGTVTGTTEEHKPGSTHNSTNKSTSY